MYHDAPAPDNDKPYKSRLTFVLESLVEESNKIANEPLAAPLHTASNIASPLPFNPHMTLSLLHVNYETSTFPIFNGSVDLQNCFKISLCSHFCTTSMNTNLIHMNNSSFTDEENAIFSAFLEQSF